MNESPAFKRMKEEGTQSKAPISEAFGQWKNAKFAVIALFGLVAGQAVVWYTGQFYALFFLQSILRVDMFTANVLIAWSLILGTGGFVLFGALSDRIGRKPIILAGCLIAAITYFPVFGFITQTANPLSTAPIRRPKSWCSPIRTTARSSLIRRARQVHEFLRRGQGLARPQLRELSGRGGARRPAGRDPVGATQVASYDAAKLSGEPPRLRRGLHPGRHRGPHGGGVPARTTRRSSSCRASSTSSGRSRSPWS
jgi:hypothetical protein